MQKHVLVGWGQFGGHPDGSHLVLKEIENGRGTIEHAPHILRLKIFCTFSIPIVSHIF
jgi:hypothetical protein